MALSARNRIAGLAVGLLLTFEPVVVPVGGFAAEAAGGAAATAVEAGSIALQGKVKQPQRFDVAALRTLPVKQEQVSFQGERAPQSATFTGAPLWAVLEAAGGLDDSAKGAELRHMIRVVGRDGYSVLISTGEIAPEFGGRPALIAYERDGKPLADNGFRLVMPGDKRGGRNVRDVVTLTVE